MQCAHKKMARWYATSWVMSVWWGSLPIGNGANCIGPFASTSTAISPVCTLQEKYQEGENVHRVYDPAKTPLERLLLSGILPAHQQQELNEAGGALDPLGLLQHLRQLQQALQRSATT